MEEHMSREDIYSLIYGQMSQEEKLRLEVVQSLSEPCDRKTYKQKLEEAAQKLGKSKRTVQRLMKDWKENGVSALFPTTRADKTKHRISQEWQEFIQDTYMEELIKGRRISIKEIALKVQERATKLGEADPPSERTIRRVLKNKYDVPEYIYSEEGKREMYRVSIPIKGYVRMHFLTDSAEESIDQALKTWDYHNIHNCQIDGSISSVKIDPSIDDLDTPREPPARKLVPKQSLVRKMEKCHQVREKNVEDYLKYEENLVWLQDTNEFPWVRCWEPEPIPWRAGLSRDISCVQRDDMIIVGYSEVKVGTPLLDWEGEEYYYRRVFLINKDDYKNYSPGRYPTEAKLTKSLKPGFAGIHPNNR
ncbi:helix-turn-helix domain-containing protein [Roseofilum sp. Guam]|uniref:helix-turn-helix domain-containing protein n=1 Tax=Roseofilum sp. Guam TaxID=2821502 RepID=UPI001B1C724E|nr:helix-turn-helix domain-containing protein [Roseofilum sp. Guam]MBP0029530.1 helix-turn-helix domain-containing protein [Roseofilum sp. Guam]